MRSATCISARHLFCIGKYHALARRVDALTSHVVQAQYNVLRRYDDGITRCRRQNIVCRHHQSARFELSFQRQRYVNRHLIAVEVGVVSSTNQWVQLNRLTFDKHWLKRLNTKTVQRWRSVQKNRVLTNHLSQDIPNLGWLTLDHLLGSFNGTCKTAVL